MAPQQPDRTAEPYEPDDIGVTSATSDFTEALGDGDGEVAGDFRAAERSAQRAAAFAVTEGFHPLRVRPYVGDPDGTQGGTATTVRPLIDVDGADDGGPATTDLGLFPAAYAAMAAAQEYPADDGSREAAGAAAAAAHGRHRRRRRGIVVAAAAVAASALAAGAVAVTGSVMGEEQGRADRAQPEPVSSAGPEVTLPAGAAPGAATQPVKVTPHHPMRATTTPAPKLTTPSASASTSATPSGTPSASASATATATASATPSDPPSSSAPAQPDVLQLGASGPEVTDLQQRLAAVPPGIYDGPMDGQYDADVQRAVAKFQLWYGVRGDPSGVYGPATRALLVAVTSNHNGGSRNH